MYASAGDNRRLLAATMEMVDSLSVLIGTAAPGLIQPVAVVDLTATDGLLLLQVPASGPPRLTYAHQASTGIELVPSIAELNDRLTDAILLELTRKEGPRAGRACRWRVKHLGVL